MSVLNDTKFLAGAWRLSGDASDGTGRYDGVLTNTPTWSTFMKNGLQCIEFDGDDAHVNVGDVVELNSASAFTICFWMNQDVLDQGDIIFDKYSGAGTVALRVQTSGDGNMYFMPSVTNNKRGWFDYSTVMSAVTWHHIATVFDGSQTGDANRLNVYVDGVPVTLTFAGGIAAATPDLSGVDARIGRGTLSLDGKLFDYRIYSIPLSRDQVNQIRLRPLPVL